MTPRQAPSSQPLQCANEAAAAAAASSSSSSRYSSSATFKGCFFLQLSISLLALAAGVAACDGESYTGNWCAAVPVAVNVQNEGHYVPAVPAVCPEHASIACGDIGHSDWCCPSGHTCGLTAADAVGCCPHGTTCGKAHEPVQEVVATTAAVAVAGAPIILDDDVSSSDDEDEFIHENFNPETVLLAPETIVAAVPTSIETIVAAVTDVYYSPIETIVPVAVAGAGEYCSTIIADGPGLPTTIPGVCGTVLVTNGGGWSTLNTCKYWMGNWHVWIGGFFWVLGFIVYI